MSNMNTDKYFSSDMSERERACFEAGIKLGALYHILIGMPISSQEEIISSIEKGIEASISCQPYVKKIEVKLKRNKIKGDKTTDFDYDEVSGDIIEAKLIIAYESVELIAKIQWIKDFQYPLMYIEDIKNKV